MLSLRRGWTARRDRGPTVAPRRTGAGQRSERASVLMLMPASVLIVLALAAIAVDLSLVFLRQREATSLATGLANDLSTVGADQAALRDGSGYRLVEEARLDRLADRWAADQAGPDVVQVDVVRVGPDTVEVQVVLRAEHLFARALPGGAGSTTVRGTARATAATG
ncbi:MAG: hypothetical protein AB7L84_04960 [Acidimicrobiia bacterium]